MFFVRYNFPLPNNGDRYDFSQEELHKLLDSVYERGYTHGVEVANKTETTVAFSTIDQAIDELKLLETITESDKYSGEIYDAFRKEVCFNCFDPNCLRSQAEIYDCDKF